MLNILENTIIPIINKFIPDKSQQDAAINQIISATAQIMIEDSKSNDLYIRRARPTFSYVMYIILLMAIPVGVFAMINPIYSQYFIKYASLWFQSIPTELYQLFGFGYGAFTIARSIDKKRKK